MLLHLEIALVVGLLPAASLPSAGAPRARARPPLLLDAGEPHGRLVLVRHGQSEWNRANLFTGWVDVDLTEQGISEAREAGKMLAAAGLEVDEVHCSLMHRAIRSAVLMLSTLGQCWVPVSKTWRLNEQHSGMLTGQNKRDLAKKHGTEQVMAWRRRFGVTPPLLDADNALQRSICADVRYDYLSVADDGWAVPSSESLDDVCERLDPLWEEQIAPALRAGRTVMVVSHGNTLRALVKRIDGVPDEDVFHLDVPTATPMLYEFDAALGHVRRHGSWGDEGAQIARHCRFLIDEDRVRAAQQAMRRQVVSNIAYTVGGIDSTEGVQESKAVMVESAGRAVEMIDGESYTVRQTPPTYFFQESTRLEQTALSDLAELARSFGATSAAGGGGGAGTQGDRDLAASSDASSGPAGVQCRLVLLRHGQSAYNKDKIFTGWADPDLTNRGREEARLAGQLLKAYGVRRIDAVFTSLLQRAVKTSWLALDELDQIWAPIRNTWRLNERNYGGLQGLVKAECAEKYGLKQVQRWRRGYADRPPPWSDAALRETVDRRYDAAIAEAKAAKDADAAAEFPPRSESLLDCTQRLLPFLDDELRAAMEEAVSRARDAADASEAPYEAPTVLVVASENVLRGLVMHMEGLGEREIPLVDVPYAVPLVYHLDEQLEPMATPWAEAPLRAGWYLGDPAKVRAVQAEIQADLPSGAEGEDVCLVPISGTDTATWKC